MAIGYLHCYVNSRPDLDWNTCGQAAVATIADYWGKNPYNLARAERDGRNGLWYWDDGEAIDAVKDGGFGPDVVFGWGTTGGRIRDALRAYRLWAEVGHSGAFFWGWEDQWRKLRSYLANNRPVPVLVDMGRLGGSAFVHHWAIAYRIADGRVYLGNCSRNPAPTESQFLSAWQSPALPYGFNHCGVYF
ncbi:MAG: hypothetical protein AVDCRST_MAG73-3020 [uncultured Thermomicrobiales bacterium]|uniref:Peptidase C39-like domain-containing protein n=1 Tax=uncultured Thermomicrobiales bacterium TaxID=1645740 RepID=A0A6J4UL14_9BACT|nr:MAG: hypothetical protein AVDCRST_MAG73-3020 [uncultured Thermomicrobiales bacterium]